MTKIQRSRCASASLLVMAVLGAVTLSAGTAVSLAAQRRNAARLASVQLQGQILAWQLWQLAPTALTPATLAAAAESGWQLERSASAAIARHRLGCMEQRHGVDGSLQQTWMPAHAPR